MEKKYWVAYRCNKNWWHKKFDSKSEAERFYKFLKPRFEEHLITRSWLAWYRKDPPR